MPIYRLKCNFKFLNLVKRYIMMTKNIQEFFSSNKHTPFRHNDI